MHPRLGRAVDGHPLVVGELLDNEARLRRECRDGLGRKEEGRRAVAARVPLAAVAAAQPRACHGRKLVLLEIEPAVVAQEELAAGPEDAGEVADAAGSASGGSADSLKIASTVSTP